MNIVLIDVKCAYIGNGEVNVLKYLVRFGHGTEIYQNIVAPLFTYYKISAALSTILFIMISMFLIPFKSISKPIKKCSNESIDRGISRMRSENVMSSPSVFKKPLEKFKFVWETSFGIIKRPANVQCIWSYHS